MTPNHPNSVNPRPFPPDTLHLYLLNVGLFVDSNPTQTLSPAELDRAKRFRFPADRARYLVGRFARRARLATFTNTSPEHLRFGENAYGKPHLIDADGLAFNVAHAGDYVALAVGRGGAVGVDVEPLRPIPDRAGMAALVFSAAEQERIQAAGDPDRAFLDHWTAKEALIKGVGMGMSYAVAEVTVHFTTTPAFTRPGHDLSAWQLARGEHDGHLWALAWDGGPRRVAVYTPQSPDDL